MDVKKGGAWRDGVTKIKVSGIWKASAKNFVKKGGVWVTKPVNTLGTLVYQGRLTTGSFTFDGLTDIGFIRLLAMGSFDNNTFSGALIETFYVNNYNGGYRRLVFQVKSTNQAILSDIKTVYINGIRGVVEANSVYSDGVGTIGCYVLLDSAPPLSGVWDVEIYY